MRESETTTNIYKALIEAAPEIKAVTKSKQAYDYKYATLDSIIDMLRLVLPKHGLWFVQAPTNLDNDSIQLATRIIHSSGEYIEEDIYFSKTDLTKGKPNNTQKIGAAITYFRRYTLAAMFGIAADEDVDGNIESLKAPHQDTKPQKPQKPKQTPAEFIEKDIKARVEAGEQYDGILKTYADILKTDEIREVKYMTPDEQRSLATEIYNRRKRNGK